jgi:hypothetical protein
MTKEQQRTLWDERFHQILKKEEPTDLDKFLNILNLVLLSEEKESNIALLFKTLGMDQTVELINKLSGITITFPDRQDIKDAMVLALFKYYRDIKHLDWKETKALLDYDDFAPLRIGRKLSKLDKNINNELEKMFNEFEEEGK